jgi:hypothetical protein
MIHSLEKVVRLEHLQKLTVYIQTVVGDLIDDEPLPTDSNDEDENEEVLTHQSSKKLKSVTILGVTYPVAHWNEAILRVCETLYTFKPEIIGNLDTTYPAKRFKRKQFARNKSDIKQRPVMLSFGIWVELNHSKNSIKNICHHLLELCGYSGTDIQYIER